MIDIDPYLPGLIRYLRQDGDIVAVWIFGSYGTPEQTPLSDVDLAVLFRPGTHPDPKRELRLAADITEIVREDDLNLVVLNHAPVTLQMRVLESGRPLYESDSAAVSDFVERVAKLYGDFAPDLLRFHDEYDDSLREAYLGGRR